MNDIIEEVFMSEIINKFCHNLISKSKYNYSDIDELKSELVMQLYKTDLKKLQDWKDRNVLEYCCITILKRILMGTNVSKESIFYFGNKEYTTPNENINIADQKDYNNHQRMEEIDDIVERLHWYDKTLFRLFYKQGYNLREISELTDINLKSVHYSISKTRKKIKDEINGNNNNNDLY